MRLRLLKGEIGMGDYYILRPCKGSVGFIATPKKNIQLNLREEAEKLQKAGYRIVDADVMLIAEDDVELTIYKSGKILARTDDEIDAKAAIGKVYKVLIHQD